MKKRILWSFGILILLLPLTVATVVWGAGRVTWEKDNLGNNVKRYTILWTADAADGSVPATAIPSINGFVFQIITIPGATAPTPLYDITFPDSDGLDVAGGELQNRSATMTEIIGVPKVGPLYQERYVSGSMTLNIINNSVNSATGTVKIYTRD